MKWNKIHRIFSMLLTPLILALATHAGAAPKNHSDSPSILSGSGKTVSLTTSSIPTVSLTSITGIGKTQQAVFSPDGHTISISSQTTPGFISILYGSSFTSYSLTGDQSVNNGPQDQTMDSKYIYAGGATGMIWQLPYTNGVAGTLQTITPTPSSANNKIYCLSLMGNYLYAGNTKGSTPYGGLTIVEVATNGTMSNVLGGTALSTWGTVLLGSAPDTGRNILFLTSYPNGSSSTNTLWALDVSTPASPKTLASIDLTPYNLGATVVWASLTYDGSRYLYLTPDHVDSPTGANTNQLLVVDTHNLTAASPSMTVVANPVNQLQNPYPTIRHAVVFLNSTTIMVTSYSSGNGYVTYFDVTDPTNPTLLGSQQLNSDVVGAAANPNPSAQPPFVAAVTRTLNEVIFYDIDVTLTVTASGDDNETITPPGPETVTYGGTQAFTVTANTGYVLTTDVGGTCPAGSWSGNTYTTGAIVNPCTVTFSALPTVTANGDGNEMIAPLGPQTVNYGATQEFTVTANTGYVLSNTVSGTCPLGSWSGNTYTTGAISYACTVTFSALPTVTPSGDGNESISPEGPQVVNYGATQAFTVNANKGYVLSTSVGGSCPVGSWSGNTYTTGPIDSTCTVSFSALPSIPASLGGSTAIDPHLVCCGRPILLGPLSVVPGNDPTTYSVVEKTGDVTCVLGKVGSQMYLKVDGNNGSCTIVATKDGIMSAPLTVTSKGKT